MLNNASARQFRIWVNLPNEGEEAGLEVTQYCSGGGFLTLNCNPIDEGGIFQLTGRLVLDVPQYDPLFDVWENPQRWQPGNYVFIKIEDSTGTLRRCPINRLRILRLPDQPVPGSWNLQIELGDSFTLYDSKTPTQISAINRSRKSALDLMLAQIDLEMEGSIYNADTALFNFSTRETIAKQAGELAIGGFSGLFQDSQGKVRAVRLNLTPEWRFHKHVVGVDCADEFEPISSQARAAESVEIATEILRSPSDTESESTRYRGVRFYETPASIASIDLDSTQSTVVVAAQGNIRWNWITSYSYLETQDEQRRRGITVPESLYEALEAQGRDINYPTAMAWINAMNSETRKSYEGQGEGRLLSETKIVYKCLGEVLAEFYKKYLLPSASLPGFLGKIVAEEVAIEYSYKKFDNGSSSGEDSGGQVRKIVYEKKEPLGLVAAGANDWIGQGVGGPALIADPRDLIVSERRVQTWSKRSSEEWEYADEHWKAGQVRSGGLKAFRQLIQIIPEGGPLQSSRSGNLQPPPAERRPAREELNRPPNSVASTATATAKLDRANNRTRRLKMKNLSQAGAKTVAELLAKIDGYREQGYRITTTFFDDWFRFRPFVRIDLEYNNRVYYGIADNVTFAFSGNQAIVVCDCMKVGRSAEAASSVNYPYLPLPPFSEEPDLDLFGPLPIGGSLPDPSGTPADDDPNPGANFQEPLVPTIDVIVEIEALSDSFLTFNFVDFNAGENPLIELTVLSDSYMEFEVEPDALPEGLFGEWPLSSATWEDIVGTNDLVEVGTGANLVFEPLGVAEFATATDVNYLHVADASLFTTRSATSNRSWQVTFDFWLPDSADPGNDREGTVLIHLVNEWRFYFFAGLLHVDIHTDGSIYGAPLGVDGNATDNAPIETWHSVLVAFDANTYQLTATLNGIAFYPGSHPYDLFGPLPDVLTGAFEVGRNAQPGTRIKNIKYYLEEVVPNP